MSETNSKKSGCAYLPILGAAILLAAGGVYFYFRGLMGKELTPLEAAKIVPQEALMTSFIETNPEPWSKLSQFGTPEAQKLVNESLANLPQEISLDKTINYEQDIKPWIGGIMLAILPPEQSQVQTDDYNVLIIVGIKDKLKAKSFSDKLKNVKNTRTQSFDYQGIAIEEITTENNNKLNLATLDNYLLLSPQRKTIEIAINAFKGNSSLANQESAKEIFSEKLNLKNSVAQVYINDYAQIIQQAAANSSSDTSISPQTLKQLKQIKSVVIGVGVEDQGLHLQAIAKLNPDEIKESFKPTQGKILSKFPADTITLMTGQGISEGWSNLVSQSQADPDLQTLVETIRQNLQIANFDADKEVFGWLDGEFGLGIINVKQGSLANLGLGGIVTLETSDRPTGQKTLDKLTQMVQATSFISVNQTKIQGTEITEWSIPQQGMVLAYGWLNNNSLLMTIGTNFADVTNTKTETSLLQSPNFKNTTASLPPNNLGYFYVDIEKAMVEVNKFSQLQGMAIPPETNAVVNSMQGLALTVTMPDKSTSQLDLSLSLKPNGSR